MSKISDGIKLNPIKMTDLKPPTEPLKKGYVPPNLRGGRAAGTKAEIPKNLDGMNFPDLGIAAPVQKTMPDFKKVVFDQIEREQLDEIERNRVKETDTSKMTRDELIVDGWAILSLERPAIIEAVYRLNTRNVTPVEKED